MMMKIVETSIEDSLIVLRRNKTDYWTKNESWTENNDNNDKDDNWTRNYGWQWIMAEQEISVEQKIVYQNNIDETEVDDEMLGKNFICLELKHWNGQSMQY